MGTSTSPFLYAFTGAGNHPFQIQPQILFHRATAPSSSSPPVASREQLMATEEQQQDTEIVVYPFSSYNAKDLLFFYLSYLYTYVFRTQTF